MRWKYEFCDDSAIFSEFFKNYLRIASATRSLFCAVGMPFQQKLLNRSRQIITTVRSLVLLRSGSSRYLPASRQYAFSKRLPTNRYRIVPGRVVSILTNRVVEFQLPDNRQERTKKLCCVASQGKNL